MISKINITTYAALATTVVFWGLSFVATKIALETLPIFALVFIRFGIASVLFIVLMVVRGFPRFGLKDHGKLVLTAVFQPGLYFLFETIGLQHTTAPKAALIIATVPVAVLVMAAILLHERCTTKTVWGIGLSFMGILVLVAGDPEFSFQWSGSLLGDLLILGAVISAAAYMVCARDLGKTHSAVDITGIQFIYGTILYAPAFFWQYPHVQWAAVSTSSFAALVYLTICVTFAGFLCYNYALTKVPASKAAVFINGIPVVTALAAWALLGETLTLLQLTGGVLVMLAVFLSNLPRRRQKR